MTGPVLYVDGPSAEEWLTNAAGRDLGIDTRHSYTIFFINWYSRPDFRFHVYTKTDQADPDTGYNFGALRDSRKMIAWGGSHGRSWFYDLSAGPEAWTAQLERRRPDLDANGIEDYRMPPIWEYSAGGYRDPTSLSSDLGLIARYVGIDLLFTTSPLYDPLVTAPGLGGAKVQNIQMFEDDPGSSGPQWIDLPHVKRMLRSFEPYYDWKVTFKDEAPIDADAQRSLRIWADLLIEDGYWNRSTASPSPSSSATSTPTWTGTSRPTTRPTMSARCSRSTRPTTTWAASMAFSATPTTTGWTARRATCSRSIQQGIATWVTASARPQSQRRSGAAAWPKGRAAARPRPQAAILTSSADFSSSSTPKASFSRT